MDNNRDMKFVVMKLHKLCFIIILLLFLLVIFKMISCAKNKTFPNNKKNKQKI